MPPTFKTEALCLNSNVQLVKMSFTVKGMGKKHYLVLAVIRDALCY